MKWSDTDRCAMEAALEEARLAALDGEVPVGAVIVDPSGSIIARGRNTREAEQLVTAHAELAAITAAERRLGSWRLTGCTLYVTLEPCFMCAAAISQAQLSRVVFAAADSKQGAIVSQANFFTDYRLNHDVRADGGLLAAEASALLREFFATLRKRNKALEENYGGRGAREAAARSDPSRRGHPETAAWLEAEVREELNNQDQI